MNIIRTSVYDHYASVDIAHPDCLSPLARALHEYMFEKGLVWTNSEITSPSTETWYYYPESIATEEKVWNLRLTA